MDPPLLEIRHRTDVWFNDAILDMYKVY